MISVFLHVVALGICGLIFIQHPQLVDEIFTTLVEPEEVGEPLAEHSLLPTVEPDTAPHDELMVPDTASLSFETQGPIALNVSDAFPQVAVNSSDAPTPKEMKVGEATVGRMSPPRSDRWSKSSAGIPRARLRSF